MTRRLRAAMRLMVCACAAACVLGTASAQTSVPAFDVLVVPFENASTEPRAYWLTEASAVLLSDELQASGVASVARDDRVRALDRLRVPSAAALSHATVIRLGQIVGASQVVVGSVGLDGDRLTVKARAIRLDEGRMTPEIVETGPLADLFAIYARVAQRVGAGFSRPATESAHVGAGFSRPVADAQRPTPAAFELYIKGLLAESSVTRVAYLNEAIKLAPAFQPPRIALWWVHTDQGEHSLALGAVRPVPEDHALWRRAQFLSTVSLLYLDQFDVAFARLSRLNTAAPDPALLNNLGIVQLRRPPGDQGGRAVSYFNEAARLDANDPALLFNAGYAHWAAGDMASAVTWLREATRLDPADAEAHYVLGAALQASGHTAEGAREKELARRLSSDLSELDAANPGANLVPSGLERMKLDIDVPAALRVETAIVEAGQRDQRALATHQLETGRRLFEAGRDSAAIAELRRAVYLAPYDADAHLLLGHLYLRGGRLADAVDALKISIWSEDTVEARFVLANAYLAIQDEAAARAELQIVLSRQPGHDEARRLFDELTEDAAADADPGLDDEAAEDDPQ